MKDEGLKLGPYYSGYLFGPGITFCDPADISTILKRIDDFPKDTKVIGSTFKFAQALFGPNGLAGINNPHWQEQRSVLNRAFVTNSIFFQPMCKKINCCITKWENAGKFSVGSDLQKLTLDVLASCIFGLDFDTLNGNSSEPLDAFNLAVETTFRPTIFVIPMFYKLPTQTNKKMIQSLDTFDKCCWKIMDQVKKNLEEKKKIETKIDDNEVNARSLIEMMYENNLSENEIRDNVSAFFFAGHETTANSLSWLLAILSSHPEVQQKARQEISEKVPNELTFNSLKELTYLDGLIKEGLRMYPPVPAFSGRHSVKDTIIGNVQVPAGTMLAVNLISMGYDPKIWGDPDVVRPERWFTENITKEQRKAWMPFSGGPRVCIGMNFSLVEQKIFLVYLLKRFSDIKLSSTGEIRTRLGGLGTYSVDTDKLILECSR